MSVEDWGCFGGEWLQWFCLRGKFYTMKTLQECKTVVLKNKINLIMINKRTSARDIGRFENIWGLSFSIILQNYHPFGCWKLRRSHLLLQITFLLWLFTAYFSSLGRNITSLLIPLQTLFQIITQLFPDMVYMINKF